MGLPERFAHRLTTLSGFLDRVDRQPTGKERMNPSANSPSRRPTLRDVAVEADTSLKTASRVVNKEGGVSPELTARVEEAVAKLGYQRDDRARQLRSGSTSTGTIGLIQNDVANPFFASIFKGVEEVAADHGNVLLSASSGGSAERQDEIVRTFISRRVDGLVIVPVGEDMTVLTREAGRGTPIVFVDLMPKEVIGDVILSDHRGGATKAVEHLIRQGHRRIAFLGDEARYTSALERCTAYRDTLAEAAIPVDEALVKPGMGDPALAENATYALLDLDDPPTAIFAAQNFVSIGVVRALARRGQGGQVAVVGFDDFECADMLDPPLSVAPQNPRELGRRAGDLLYRRLEGFDGPPQVVELPVEIIERGSGEIAGPWSTGSGS